MPKSIIVNMWNRTLEEGHTKQMFIPVTVPVEQILRVEGARDEDLIQFIGKSGLELATYHAKLIQSNGEHFFIKETAEEINDLINEVAEV